MDEKFCLKWNDLHSNLSSQLKKLNSDDYLNDVTLITDDNNQLPAHKLILSVCSDYFQMVFKNNKHQNLFICLEGVTKQDLENCLSYMYNGEVQIYQNDLDRCCSKI